MANLTNDSFNLTKTIVNNLETGSYYNLWQKILFSFFIFPIIILSICGNALVIVAICKYSYLRITNNIFLASLGLRLVLLFSF